MYTLTKRKVRVILDIECYDDLDIEALDWNDILHLEGDENVDTTIQDDEIDWWVCRFVDWHKITHRGRLS